jgi:hypothetical protein
MDEKRMKKSFLLLILCVTSVCAVASEKTPEQLDREYKSCMLEMATYAPDFPMKEQMYGCFIKIGLPINDEKKEQAAIKKMNQCWERNAAKYDDGVSSAELIARIVAPKCSKEFHKRVDLMWQLPNVKKELKRQYDNKESLDFVIEAILEHRAANKMKKQNK